MRKVLCVCGIVAVGAWFVTPTTGVIGVMRTIVVDLIGVAIGLMGVVGGWASEVMGARPIILTREGPSSGGDEPGDRGLGPVQPGPDSTGRRERAQDRETRVSAWWR